MDIAGGTLLWFFGLPNIVSINKTNELPLKETIKILEERGELSEEFKKHRLCSKLGLLLLVFGFLLQLIGNCIDVGGCQ